MTCIMHGRIVSINTNLYINKTLLKGRMNVEMDVLKTLNFLEVILLWNLRIETESTIYPEILSRLF